MTKATYSNVTVYAPLQSSYGNSSDSKTCQNMQLFNISTLQLSYIGDLGDGSGDTDNFRTYFANPNERAWQ